MWLGWGVHGGVGGGCWPRGVYLVKKYSAGDIHLTVNIQPQITNHHKNMAKFSCSLNTQIKCINIVKD